jgi:hypothetical protein
MNKLAFLFAILVALASCDKEDETQPEATAFTFTASDSLIFEHSGVLPYAVAVQSESGKSFIATFSGLFDSFVGNVTLSIPSNESRSIDVSFNQFGVNPGAYPCTLTVAVPNENNAVKTTTVQMVYKPNCAYAFRNYTIAEITYEINGILENRSIACSYNASGQLEVVGLTPFLIKLNFDCSNSTVEMDPTLHLGNVVTCTGTIEGSEIALQFFNDGVFNATGRIKL